MEQEKITVKEYNAHIIFIGIGFSHPFSRQLKYTSFTCYTKKRKTKRQVRTGGLIGCVSCTYEISNRLQS